MKRQLSCQCVSLGAAALVVAVAAAVAADVISDLGVTQARAQDGIFEAFTSGAVPVIGNAKVFTSAAPDKRVLFVRGVTALARTYAQSADFKKRYTEYREANKPQPPEAEQTADQLNEAQRKQIDEAVRQLQETMKNLPPEQQKELQQEIARMRAEFAQMAKDPEQKAAMGEALKQQHAAAVEQYRAKLKQWESDFPSDANILIARRLREFLDVTTGIDYAAKLVEKDGKKRFAEPTLEQKSREWKMCFRAGREATEAARAFARAWLKDLEPGR